MKGIWSWRSFLFQVHLLGGLIAAAFLLLLGATGCVMAFESEIDHLLHPTLFRVTPGGQALPLTKLASQVVVVMQPGERIGVCVLPVKPDVAYAFTLVAPNRLPRQVFVNEYTGQVLGALSVVRFVLVAHKLHEASGTVMGTAAIVLVSSVLSGLYLWWPLKRVKIAVRGTRWQFYFDLHNSLGFFSSLFLLVFAVTGTYMAFENWTVPATYKISGTKPLQEDPVSSPLAGAGPISPDTAISVAKDFLPTAVPLWIVLPEEQTASYLVKMRFPEDHSSNGTSIVWIDQYSVKVLSAWNSRTAPLGRRVEILNRSVHTGDFWGYPGRSVACLMSLALVVQTVTGPYLWWKRRRDKKTLAAN
jgi:uncharacterized iron-regulated membrane protein